MTLCQKLRITLTKQNWFLKWLILFRKLTELENKVPDISNLATKTALTTVENKIPNVSNLVNKPDYNIKIAEIENKLTNHNHDKYIDTSQFNTLATNFSMRE